VTHPPFSPLLLSRTAIMMMGLLVLWSSSSFAMDAMFRQAERRAAASVATCA
jgi:hypothetical protein